MKVHDGFRAWRVGRWWQFDIRDTRKSYPLFSERYAGQHGIPPLPWNNRIDIGPYRIRVGFLPFRRSDR